MTTKSATLIQWTDEDGSTAIGEIVSSKVEHNAGLDMDLTHVVIRWSDGLSDTQHTLESLRVDSRVKFMA